MRGSIPHRMRRKWPDIHKMAQVEQSSKKCFTGFLVSG